jgi:oligopeptide transport system substrate-binding protein
MINLQKRKNLGILGLIGLLLIILFFSGVFKAHDAFPTDTIHRGNSTEPIYLDPHLSSSLNESNIQRDLFEGLTAESAAGNIIPGVAERWEISEDQLKWTFFLRKDAKWSNGEPLTAHDFVNGFRRAVDPTTASSFGFLLKPLVWGEKILSGEEKDLTKLGVVAIDDYTLEIELEFPVHHLLTILAHHTTYPFPQKVYEAHKAKWTDPENIISNGPYRLADWVRQTHIKLIKNDHYWDKKNVKTQNIVYYPTEDSHAELKRFIASEIHTTETIPYDQIEWIEQNMQGSLRSTAYPGIVFYAFNMTIEPFKSNLKLRQALALAIDRNLITEKIAKLGAKPAYSWIPKGVGTYKPQDAFFSTLKQEEREAKAKDLFLESGFTLEAPLKIEILLSNSAIEKNLATAIAGMWKKVLNIDVVLHDEEWKTYVANRGEKKFQVIHLNGVADFPVPSAFLEIFLSEKNTAGYSNTEFDQLVQTGIAEHSMEEQNKLFAEAERRFLSDLPVIPLYYPTKKHLVNTHIQGWLDNFSDIHPSKYLSITIK